MTIVAYLSDNMNSGFTNNILRNDKTWYIGEIMLPKKGHNQLNVLLSPSIKSVQTFVKYADAVAKSVLSNTIKPS